jgi:signal transduction protein with GAF and PtsI domain
VTRPKAFPVTVCGEMASDPCAVIGLLALEIYSFSMSAGSLINITDLIHHIEMNKIDTLKESLISAASAMRVYDILRDFHQRNPQK